MYDVNEQTYELWETQILAYSRLKGLKEIVLNRPGPDAAVKNKSTYAELIQF